jgi:hypothetical protein
MAGTGQWRGTSSAGSDKGSMRLVIESESTREPGWSSWRWKGTKSWPEPSHHG